MILQHTQTGQDGIGQKKVLSGLYSVRLKAKKVLSSQTKKIIFYFAERKGFEPPVPVKVQLLSREPRSTTLAPLQF